MRWLVLTLLILAGVVWLESRNRYVETNTAALPVGPATRSAPVPNIFHGGAGVVFNGSGSSFVFSLESRADSYPNELSLWKR